MSITDAFQHHGSGLDSPASHAVAITPSDTEDLAAMPRALFAAVEGTVRVTMRGGGAPVTFAMQAGAALPVRASRVWETGTTASGIIGVW